MAVACLGFLLAPGPAVAAPPGGFAETTAFTGLVQPTVVRFAPDGRVFVAEKSGLIQVFDGFADPTPTEFADLRTQVYNFWDRGLLGMTLDPDFADNGFVYVSYAHDAEIGGTAPKWGTAGQTADPCPSPPGPNADGCLISGRISRLNSSGAEQVLIEDYCQQYPSHSIGSLEHDSTGALWASGGDGASFTFADYGQDGDPVNPCDDPPAEGGALRSQDLRTGGDPVSLDGTLIRIDDATGDGVATNPLAGDADANARRIVASGFRNPFRFTISPDDEIYVGDVGWTKWEEINRFPVETATLRNFGWPCYEGNGAGVSAKQPAYDSDNLAICEDLYTAPGAVEAPFFAYDHATAVGAGCEAGSSAIAGLEFYTAGAFPAAYDDALLFADHNRDCIWVMTAGADGKPDPASVTPFQSTALNPVYLDVGPDGALYYVNFEGGTIQRIAATGATPTPNVSSSGGTVTYTGDATANDPVVTESGSNYRFTEAGITAGAGCAQVNASTADCSKVAPTSVVMNLGDGDDTVNPQTVDEDPFTINGEGGNDGPIGVNALYDTKAADTLNGGPGNDNLHGGDVGAGADTINGDAGNDRLLGGLGADVLDGGPGIDRSRSGEGCGATPNAINITLDNVANDVDCDGSTTENVMDTVESINGSDVAGDVITGSCFANTIAGDSGTTDGSGGGIDTIKGDPDTGCAPNGADFIAGGEGSDILHGDGAGTAGFDTVTYGFPLTDTVAPGITVTLNDLADDNDGWGNTTENVSGDFERVIGNQQNDTINATAADQAVQLFGRLGNDTLTDGAFGDLLDGEGGTADTVNCPNGGYDGYRNAEVVNDLMTCEIGL